MQVIIVGLAKIAADGGVEGFALAKFFQVGDEGSQDAGPNEFDSFHITQALFDFR